MNRVGIYFVLVTVIALALGFGGGIAADRLVFFRGSLPTEPADARDSFGVFWQAWRLVEEKYVDQSVVTPANLTHGAIAGMLDALGDTGHSRFLSATDRQAEQENLSGHFQGIGVEVEVRDGRVTVVSPLDGSPAQHSGIMSGDVIEKVNGQDVSRAGLDEVSRLIRGPQGTTVVISVLRPGAAELLDFTIVRQDVKVADVTWTTVPGEKIAHIRISSFGDSTDTQLRSAIADARKAGDTRFILDLRNDPGGLLDQAVHVSSEFLTSGNVLLEQDRSGHRDPVAVTTGGIAPTEPIVVLVNHGTASAAEIVAGALQDQGRASVIGEQTFGTGTVLREYGLSDGSGILIGESEWLTPNGRSIRNNGITPNKVVAGSQTTGPLVPTEERTLTPDQVRGSTDQQLLIAINTVR